MGRAFAIGAEVYWREKGGALGRGTIVGLGAGGGSGGPLYRVREEDGSVGRRRECRLLQVVQLPLFEVVA